MPKRMHKQAESQKLGSLPKSPNSKGSEILGRLLEQGSFLGVESVWL
jgi:hypothetical protein